MTKLLLHGRTSFGVRLWSLGTADHVLHYIGLLTFTRLNPDLGSPAQPAVSSISHSFFLFLLCFTSVLFFLASGKEET